MSAVVLPAVSLAQARNSAPISVALVKMPYVGERNIPELSGGPDYLQQGGLQKILEQHGFQTKQVSAISLAPEEDKAYGAWNRLALANGDLAKVISEERRSGNFPIGLLANCSSILGMLSGLQHSGPNAKPLRVGLVFIDAHGDYNTPETTLSGMLGGMPVAIAGGLCLTRMRLKTGLEPAIPGRHIVEICVRDTDPLEQELLDRSEIQQLSLEDVRSRSANLHREMQRLSEATDVIYIMSIWTYSIRAKWPGIRSPCREGRRAWNWRLR
jgi:arginase